MIQSVAIFGGRVKAVRRSAAVLLLLVGASYCFLERVRSKKGTYLSFHGKHTACVLGQYGKSLLLVDGEVKKEKMVE